LAETRAQVDFTQGLDLRLLTDEKIAVLKKIRTKLIHFAWDRIKDEKIILERLSTFIKETGYGYQRISVYVLVNFDTTFEQDLHRIYKLRDIGANPFVMVFDTKNANKKYKDLQRYVNRRVIFRSIRNFEEYTRSHFMCREGELF